jgi:MFS family permease
MGPANFLYARVVMALGATMIVGWGTIFYAFGILAPRMIAETGLSRGYVYGCFSAALFVSGAVAPSAGRMVDHLGGRRVMAMGSLIAAAGFALLAWSANGVIFALAWLVLGASIPFVLYDPAFATVTALAGSRAARRLITQITLFGGLASTVFWPATLFLDQAIGWQATWLVYGAINLFLCAPLHYFLLPDRGGTDPQSGAANIAEEAPLVAPAQRPVTFVMLAVLFAANNFMLSGLTVHMMPTLTELGLSAREAVSLGALIGPMQVAGRMGELMVGRAVSPIAVALLATAALCGAFLIVMIFGVIGYWGVAFVLVYGAANGVITVARGTLPLALFGRAGFGSALGRLARPTLVAAAVAPFIYAVVIERLHASAGIAVSSVAAGVSFIAMAAIALHVQRSESRRFTR